MTFADRGVHVLKGVSGEHRILEIAAYVHQLEAAGIPGSSDQMLANGYEVCADLRNGGEFRVVVGNLATHAGLTWVQAQYEGVQAATWLCADEDWKVFAPQTQ